ncbi:MAG TPA: hypothetical protein VM327_08160 [Candidatus Thermoplasmatota archaeon]|nr:hypothetical protein [Candidatus Thermoplasmatota archaeon]
MVANGKEERKPLPITTPVVALGKKRFAVYERDWKGQPQATIEEVTALPDPKDATRNIGYTSVYGGLRFSGAPDAVRDFLSNARGLVMQLPSLAVPAPDNAPAPRVVAKP